MKKIFFIYLLLSGVGMNGFAQEKPKQDVETPELLAGQWSVEKANDWYAKQAWIVGCNFLPSTAVNDVEMWQDKNEFVRTLFLLAFVLLSAGVSMLIIMCPYFDGGTDDETGDA